MIDKNEKEAALPGTILRLRRDIQTVCHRALKRMEESC